jgi:Tol biopolymer transport system component
MCGQRPFLANDIESMLALVRRAQVHPPSELDPALARYDRVFRTCLAADPFARPPDMHAMARLLRAAAEPRRRRRRWWVPAAALAVATTATAGVLVWPGHRDPPHAAAQLPAFDQVRRLTFESDCAEFPSISRDGRRVMFDAARGTAYVLEEIDGEQRRSSLTTGPGWDIAPAISPDGKHLAFLRKQDGPYRTMIGDIGLLEPLRELTPGATRPTWTPDGTAVWAGNGEHAIRFDLATGKPGRTIDAPSPLRILQLVELRDGALAGLVFDPQADGFPKLATFDAGGQLHWLYEGELDEVLAPAPDGHSVVISLVADPRRQLAVMPLTGGKPIPVLDPSIDARKGLSATPDWSRIVWSDCTQHIGVALVRREDKAEKLIPLTEGGTWSDAEPVAVPGTRQLVVVSDRDSTAKAWLIDREAAAPPRMLSNASVTRLDVTRDRTTLIYSNDDGELWRIAIDGTGEPVRLAKADGLTAPAVGPDGTIYYESDGETYTVPVAGGAPQHRFTGRSAAPSPAGNIVIYARGELGKATLVVRDVATGAERPLAPDQPPAEWNRIRFSEDGQRIVVQRSESQVLVLEVSTGKVIDRVDVTTRSFVGATLMGPHGEELIVGQNWWRGNVWIANAK